MVTNVSLSESRLGEERSKSSYDSGELDGSGESVSSDCGNNIVFVLELE